MVAAGAIIWISVRPLIRLFICVTCGFVLTKADLFPVLASRTLGQVILNVTLPSLMFSKMVPAFTPENIGALGPLVLVAVIYEVLGVFMAWICKTFFWVPHRFRYGILVAGGWGNVGDIPTSVIMSITGAAPFGGSDQTLSVAYISAFILVYMITLFPMGAHYLVLQDFVGPEVENYEVQEQVREKRKVLLYGWPKALLRLCRRQSMSTKEDPDPENQSSTGQYTPEKEQEQSPSFAIRPRSHNKRVSFLNNSNSNNLDHHRTYEDHELDATTAVPTDGAAQSHIASPAPTVTAHDFEYENPREKDSSPRSISGELEKTEPPPPLTESQRRRKRILAKTKVAIKSLFNPCSITMIVAIPIALIAPLKGLFTPTSNASIPNAPDGEPPLAFILDFANFMGAASVPLGLICLGSALARLNVPRSEWSKLPTGAIFSLAVLKMVVSPVIGVVMTIGLTSAGVISKEDKVLQFVCMFFSCLPTATTQVYLTQVYSGTGSAEFLSPFLLPQYFLMFFSMTGLTAYSLAYLF
ncbi:hypothetical protein GYMLUDRAFT_49707 [Collybiopsis luxurians FD-317 M1]|uniref:Auxin efflux carrier n=1 Tax=Collybiopsis luxurians FD-317 M1 TaxID=944289 RepID=A0A0D0BE27_9AGAR|nr:hypothetical protein GYMLUDRAFT_49707 [Collybiopsis luxurians FD-317 M1]